MIHARQLIRFSGYSSHWNVGYVNDSDLEYAYELVAESPRGRGFQDPLQDHPWPLKWSNRSIFKRFLQKWRTQFEVDQDGNRVTGKTPKHNGKFFGHGVVFYAINPFDNAVCTEWDVPLRAENMRRTITSSLAWPGFANKPWATKLVEKIQEADLGDDKKVCVEYLACVKI